MWYLYKIIIVAIHTRYVNTNFYFFLMRFITINRCPTHMNKDIYMCVSLYMYVRMFV